jgi:hypothetical protein
VRDCFLLKNILKRQKGLETPHPLTALLPFQKYLMMIQGHSFEVNVLLFLQP